MRPGCHNTTPDVEVLARAVLDDLDSAGVLADLVDETDSAPALYANGKPSPSRGVLLRRRWEKWQRDRDARNILCARSGLWCTAITWRNYQLSPEELGLVERVKNDLDRQFRTYIRARFIVPVRTR